MHFAIKKYSRASTFVLEKITCLQDLRCKFEQFNQLAQTMSYIYDYMTIYDYSLGKLIKHQHYLSNTDYSTWENGDYNNEFSLSPIQLKPYCTTKSVSGLTRPQGKLVRSLHLRIPYKVGVGTLLRHTRPKVWFAPPNLLGNARPKVWFSTSSRWLHSSVGASEVPNEFLLVCLGGYFRCRQQNLPKISGKKTPLKK